MKKEEKKINIKTDKLNPKKDTKIRIFYIAISLFIILTILIYTKAIESFDLSIQSFIIGIRNDNLTNIMITITNIGRAYALIAISTLLFFFIKNKKIPLTIAINLICVFLTSQLFKIIFRRPRPDGLFLIGAKGYSYPSGHAMVNIAYFTFIAYVLCKRINNKLIKSILIAFTSLLIFLIGFSRIYLGVHYTSDIIGGFLLGLSYLMIYLKIINNNTEVKK